VSGALRDQPTLPLGQRVVEVQQEWIDVGTQLGDDERDAFRHQAADEVIVAAEPVAQLRCLASANAAASCGSGRG
jgi:hypothetical protein